ncbi:Alpha/Beta hydrolase protein [Podospora australis]|uniref:Alpha/Beta hydrolase protein n=1 Tax=Podospora australis TaxID=1536484 RepID=A0AAN6WM68_9PEZI|nr:Alpha/Beta hydrolase protein [Podospora australis]
MRFSTVLLTAVSLLAPAAMSQDLITPIKIQFTNLELADYYDQTNVTYKTVNNASIDAVIFVPKGLKHKPAPVVVQFHGGALVVGTNPEPAFFPNWVMNLPRANNAILVSPAYRLAPEAKAYQILEDIRDFWKWLHSGTFQKALPNNVSADLSKILVAGESAGGYLSLQSALLFNDIAKIKAVIAQYPGGWPDIKGFNPTPAVVDPALNKFLDDFLKTVNPGEDVLSQSPWPQRADLFNAIFATGRLREMYGTPEDLVPATLEYALKKATSVPPVWFLQGDHDSIVPKETTDEVIAKLKKAHPKTDIKYTVRPGEHGFDGFYSLDKPFIAEGVAFVKKYWLRDGR